MPYPLMRKEHIHNSEIVSVYAIFTNRNEHMQNFIERLKDMQYSQIENCICNIQ